MPWRVGTVSELRWNFVQEIITLKKPVAAACRQYGISRTTGHKWLRRHQAGEPELVDRSRRPTRSPARTASALEEAVLAVRDRYGWGAPKIRAYLRNTAAARGAALPALSMVSALPSERTVGNILRRHGRIAPPAPPEPPPQRFERTAPHELWQCDFKGPLEVERRRVWPFTLLDDHSRFLLALTPCTDVTMASAWAVLWNAFGEYGLPQALLCDGSFAGGHAGLRTLSWIEGRLIRLGVRPAHGRPYHPQTQGKVERLHGTLEREVWPRVDRTNAAAFTRDLERWRREVYNVLRPHEALDDRPPLSRFAPNPRQRPQKLPEVSYPVGSVLRKVNSSGDVSWNGYRLLVGAGVSGEWVRVEDTDDEVRLFYDWKEIRRVPHTALRGDKEHLL